MTITSIPTYHINLHLDKSKIKILNIPSLKYNYLELGN